MEETGILENLALLSLVLPQFEPGRNRGRLDLINFGFWILDFGLAVASSAGHRNEGSTPVTLSPDNRKILDSRL